MFGTKNIKEDFPKWEDRVKYLFKLTPDNKVTRNQEIDPAYFMNDVAYGRYLNHKDKVYTYRTIEFSKEVFKSSDILFYLYYGYKPDCIFVKNEKDSPVLEDLEDIPTTKHLKRSERFDNKPFAIEYMNECFYLKDGLLYFNERPFTHFKTWKEWKTWNEKYAHKNELEQFSIVQRGYKIISINGIGYQFHRMKIQIRDQIILSKDVLIDHINRDTSDNSFENLRLSDCVDNTRNRNKMTTPTTSKFKGVHFILSGSNRGKWRSKCYHDGSSKFLGHYRNEIDAAIAYDNYIIKNNLLHTTNKELGLFD